MKLPPFEYLEPSTVQEALSMLDAYRDTVQIIAGGTEVVNRLKLRLIRPDYIMNIKKLRDLEGIVEQEQSIVIGANVSLNEIRDSFLLQHKYKAVAEAAFQVGQETGITQTILSGGVFHNVRILAQTMSGLEQKGFIVYTQTQVKLFLGWRIANPASSFNNPLHGIVQRDRMP